MASINYNGMLLEEVTSDKPVAFPEGTKAICWDSDIYKEGFWSLLDIVAFIPYLKDPVLTRDYLNDYQDSPYRHCALLPDPPKPRRATNRELARWLAQGNGEVKYASQYAVSERDLIYDSINSKKKELEALDSEVCDDAMFLKAQITNLKEQKDMLGSRIKRLIDET